MPCKICGEPLIADPNFKLWCANCSPNHLLYSKEETHLVVESLYYKCEEEFRNKSKPFDKKELINFLNESRNEPNLPFFNRYFTYSLSMSILYRDFIKYSNPPTRKINNEDLDYLFTLSNALYINKQNLYFTNFDTIRYIEYPPEEPPGIKYTENWIPIYKRQLIMGTWPEEPEVESDLNMDLLTEFIYRQSFLNDLQKKNKRYGHISETLELLQRYHFYYPWDNYLKIGRSKSDIDFFLTLSKKLVKKNIMSQSEFNSLKKDEVEFINNNWLLSKSNHLEFPVIISIEDKYLVPNLFFALTHQIYNIFSRENSSKLGGYRKNLGIALEDRIFNDLQVYQLDFRSLTTPTRELLRYPNPYKIGQELFDVGVLDHKLRKFYIIECKNKTQLNLRTYNPKLLNDAIIEEFEEFRDRDLPDVEKLKEDWGISSYETIPMFYNFVPLLGEFQQFEKFQLLDGIYVISTYSEIGAIINTNFHVGKYSFYDIFNIPKKLKEIIEKKLLTTVNYQKEQDLGSLIGETEEKYLIVKAKVIKVYEDDYIPELWVKLYDKPNILYLDIPPEIWKDMEKLNLKKDDIISVLIYRLRPYANVIILGNIWKLD